MARMLLSRAFRSLAAPSFSCTSSLILSSNTPHHHKNTLPLPPPICISTFRLFSNALEEGVARCEAMFSKVHSFRGTTDAANRMIHALQTEGYSQEAQVLKTQMDQGCLPMLVPLTGVMEEYADAGDIEMVIRVFTVISHRKRWNPYGPNAYAYSVIIKALAAEPGFVKLAMHDLLEMMTKGMHPNAETYTAVFEACARRWEEEAEEDRVEDEEVKEYVMLMKARGFKPEKKAVRQVLAATNTEAAVVVRVFDFLFEDSDDHGLQQLLSSKMQTPEGVNATKHFTKMFAGLMEDGYFKAAIEIKKLTLAKGFIPDVVIQTGLMEAYASAGMAKEVLNVYNSMISSGITPNGYTNGVLIRALAADVNFLDDAIKYWLEMRKKEMQPNDSTFRTLITALEDAGKDDEEFARLLA